jgi:hypothetical protein
MSESKLEPESKFSILLDSIRKFNKANLKHVPRKFF